MTKKSVIPTSVKTVEERRADYRAFVASLDKTARIPTFAEWQMSIETPIIVETPKWPIEPVRDAVKKRPVAAIAGALLLGLASGGIIGPQTALVLGELLGPLLRLFGL